MELGAGPEQLGKAAWRPLQGGGPGAAGSGGGGGGWGWGPGRRTLSVCVCVGSGPSSALTSSVTLLASPVSAAHALLLQNQGLGSTRGAGSPSAHGFSEMRACRGPPLPPPPITRVPAVIPARAGLQPWCSDGLWGLGLPWPSSAVRGPSGWCVGGTSTWFSG